MGSDHDPILIGNMNLSPHFPITAKIWLAARKNNDSEQLDESSAADVVSMGFVVQAWGHQSGTRTSRGRPLARVCLMPASSYRPGIRKWSNALLKPGADGSLAVDSGHNVQFVPINGSGSKLDAFLDRSLAYEVGRCVDDQSRVECRVILDLTNDIALGERPPEYMVSLSKEDPTEAVNVVLTQMYLLSSAQITEVKIGSKSLGYSPFDEQGRPAVVLGVTLPPLEEKEPTFDFSEPASDGPTRVGTQTARTRSGFPVSDKLLRDAVTTKLHHEGVIHMSGSEAHCREEMESP